MTNNNRNNSRHHHHGGRPNSSTSSSRNAAQHNNHSDHDNSDDLKNNGTGTTTISAARCSIDNNDNSGSMTTISTARFNHFYPSQELKLKCKSSNCLSDGTSSPSSSCMLSSHRNRSATTTPTPASSSSSGSRNNKTNRNRLKKLINPFSGRQDSPSSFDQEMDIWKRSATIESRVQIRIIKPMAIRPPTTTTSMNNSTSNHIQQQHIKLIESNPSAFHQPTINMVNQQHNNNPYSNPISMESIDDDDDLVASNRHDHKSESPEMDPQVVEQAPETQKAELESPTTEAEPANSVEPIHMTLEEVRRIAFGSPERRPQQAHNCSAQQGSQPTPQHLSQQASKCATSQQQQQKCNAKTKIKNLFDNLLNKTQCISSTATGNGNVLHNDDGEDKEDTENHNPRSPVFVNHIRDLLCHQHNEPAQKTTPNRRRHRYHRTHRNQDSGTCSSPFIRRALPPVPNGNHDDSGSNQSNNRPTIAGAGLSMMGRRYQSLQRVSRNQFKSMSEYERKKYLDYVSSIEKVKNCGWYWGPISGEMAEKLLAQEPCGSFLVRDSSDEHYIFSLSFKLDGMVRHVRIEQEQGNFSFGSLKKFRSSTIVDFIKSAMEHSRSGQFLFFLRLGPELGPIRVQLLHPVSRFKRVQSLQHICRFVILQYVRRDQIDELALPEYLRRYLDTPYYYSEELAQMDNDICEETKWQQELNKKRNFFLDSDYKTLMEKMLIDRRQMEQRLSIRLSNNIVQHDQQEPEPGPSSQSVPSGVDDSNQPDDQHDDQDELL